MYQNAKYYVKKLREVQTWTERLNNITLSYHIAYDKPSFCRFSPCNYQLARLSKTRSRIYQKPNVDTNVFRSLH